MSLILEALRRSEAERRRTQVPDLLAQPQAVDGPARSSRPSWPLLLLGGGLLLGTWMLRGSWMQPQPAGEPDTAHATRSADALSASPVVPALPSRLPSSPPAASAGTAQRPLILAPPPATARVRATPVAAAAADAPTASLPSRPASLATPEVTHSFPATVAPPLPPTDAMTRLADLGSDERKQLPPLKLSMHMWNDVPSQRFVIIDGTRLTIGERIGAATIADIVSDGVVLDWNGRLLKLPLR